MIDRYIDPLPLPPRLVSGTQPLHIRMAEFRRKLHSQLPATKLWGYEGHYPGPTIEAKTGSPMQIVWENALPHEHIFAIDPRIHGAMPPTPAVRTVPHLHGSRTESESDGLPEKWFTPGKSARYSYPNQQAAATLWYHDHAVGITRLNVYAGLSGFCLLRDEAESGLDLPAGDYEIPLMLQDRRLDDQGQLVYSPTHEDGIALPPGAWGPEFFGNLPVINGAIYPYVEVEPRLYRLRLLSSANARFWNLAFNLAKSPTDPPNLLTIRQIGTDGGFLTSAAELKTLLLGPAERADLLVDFSGLDGKTVTLTNNAAAPYPGWFEMSPSHMPLPGILDMMQFRVTRPLANGGKSPKLALLPPVKKLEAKSAVVTRDFVLTEKMDAQGHSLGVRINEKGYDDPVTEIVNLDTTEIWRFINTTDDAHPMHLHLVQFQILQRQGYDSAAMARGQFQLIGLPRLPLANEAGWKDTAVVNPGEVLSIIVRFEGFTGRYVFHCHMLEHEDNDMMRPYEVRASMQQAPESGK